MAEREFIEYKKSTKNAIKKYESIFGEDSFPSYYFEYEMNREIFEDEIIKSIERSINENKSVFELNIVPLSALNTCY